MDAARRPTTAVGHAAASQQPPSVCCLLPSGEICVAQEPTHQLLILTLSGELRNVVDVEGSLLSFPTGLACDSRFLYVTDGMRDRVHQLSIRDGFKPHACSFRTGNGRDGMYYPHGSCLLSLQPGAPPTLFVADWGNHRIVALDTSSDLDVLYSFGQKGRGAGQLMYPRGVAALPDSKLLVSDTDNNRLQIASADGTFLRCIGGLRQPYAAVGVPGNGLTFVATMSGRLCMVALEGSQGRLLNAVDGSTIETMAIEEDAAMPADGQILCGLCTDGRRVLVAGVDEDRQLHLLAARGGGATRRGEGRSDGRSEGRSEGRSDHLGAKATSSRTDLGSCVGASPSRRMERECVPIDGASQRGSAQRSSAADGFEFERGGGGAGAGRLGKVTWGGAPLAAGIDSAVSSQVQGVHSLSYDPAGSLSSPLYGRLGDPKASNSCTDISDALTALSFEPGEGGAMAGRRTWSARAGRRAAHAVPAAYGGQADDSSTAL